MTLLSLVLVVLSCVAHASWNLLSKRSNKTPGFFWLAGLAFLVMATPFFWGFGGLQLGKVPPLLWRYLLIAGIFQSLYFYNLATAYRHGDVSLVYPLARTSPLFLVPLVGFLQAKWPSPLGAGIFMTVLGCFLLPLKDTTPGSVPWKRYLNRAGMYALFTAMASSGYTYTDSLGMNLMKGSFPGIRGAFFYGYVEWAFTTVFLTLLLLRLEGKAGMVMAWKQERRSAFVISALMFFGYLLILWAYTLVSNVAYIAGSRQLSIVLGVLGGIFFFKEAGGRQRLLASLIIVVGLVLIVWK